MGRRRPFILAREIPLGERCRVTRHSKVWVRMVRRFAALVGALVLLTSALVAAGAAVSPVEAQAATTGPLHTTGRDTVIYDASNQPVRLVGFNWTGTENGGRNDNQKTADVCGKTWRTPADPIGGQSFNYDNIYQVIRDWGYNTLRVPISWNNLEPVAPVWSANANRYLHTFNQTYLNDLKSMVTKAHANGLMVILDMHQDYWSPALHHITNWDGSPGYCEGVGMPRWLDPSIDAKATTTQKQDFYNAMNWFYRDIPDPSSTLTHASPWQLFYSVWDQISYEFSQQSGFADYQAVAGADILNEPYFSYVGGSPPPGQTVLQAAGSRLAQFYNAIAPAITGHAPSWLLFFQDSTGGYNRNNPAARETPTITAKPTVPGNWVYSIHDYDFAYGTFSDGVTRHDDFGITLANAVQANASTWAVPLYIGEFTNFTLGVDARQLTDADMAQTVAFLSWAKQNHVSWTFWAYVNPYRPMTVIDYTTNQVLSVVLNALETGQDLPGSNASPVASFTNTCSALSCSFDATGSTDPDGSVVAYAWTFGDGTTSALSAPAHTYPAAGTYTVSLTVTDNVGATATKTSTVTVTSPALYASDAFSRNVAAGWGAADAGGMWSTGGSAATFAVNGGVGSINMATAGSGPSIFLNSASSSNTDVVVVATTNKAPTGGGIHLSVIGRRVANVGDYRAKVHLLSTGRVGLSLLRISATGTETVLKAESIVSGLAYSALTGLRIRFQAVGTNPTTLRAKVWLNSGTEPAAWAASATDTTGAFQVPGSVGLMSYLSGSSTNAPTVARFDNFQAGPPG